MPSTGSGSASGIITLTTYADIEAVVAFLLTDEDAAQVTFVVNGVVAELLTLSECFTTYAALTASQKVLFDRMAGYKAAYLLYNVPTTTIGTGAIKKKTQEGLSVEYDVGTTVAGSSAFWLSEYERLLALLCPDYVDPRRRARSSSPVSTLPNSFDPRDSLYPPDVERVADLETA